ncbi:MAG: ABC transporter substrate-binding protein [Tractidigestivibacter sp.]|jgi:sn-glycerol 3-phosphate transport system substrate-binding protein|uniref:ABC transporter substrate-binding protein n=1 Tax=Tractidigestivibacter sp. TaxID=2847320 RepID=UPI003D903268
MMTAAGLAGCNSNGGQSDQSSSSQSDETIELTYWYCWTGAVKENNDERVEEFNDSVGNEKNIHVTGEPQGSYDDLNAKLKTAFTANEEPDVCVLGISNTAAFYDSGLIQPIDDIIASDDLDDFWPGLMENCYADSKLCGVPYLRSTPILYYNKTLFENAGLDPETAPATWDDVVSYSDALKDVGVFGLGFFLDAFALSGLLRCNGCSFFGDDLDATEVAYNQPGGVELVQWLRDGISSHNFSYLGGTNGSDSLASSIAGQQVAIWMGSTAGLTNYLTVASDNGFEVGCGFIPKHVQNQVPTGGCNLVMTSRLTDARREAAGEFINFMTSKDSAVKNHLKTGYLLTRKSDVDDERIVEAYKETPQYQVAFDQMEYAVGEYMNAGYSEALKYYTDALERLFATDDDIQTVLDDAAQQSAEALGI